MGESIATAIEKAGVKHVVNLSSQGGHLPGGTGPIKGLHDQEKRLNKVEGVHILHLRPTYFMENLLAFVDMIHSSDMTGSAIDGDLNFPMIATRDIAAFAAERLLNKDFTGITVKNLLGQRDLTMDEATRIIGQKNRQTLFNIHPVHLRGYPKNPSGSHGVQPGRGGTLC